MIPSLFLALALGSPAWADDAHCAQLRTLAARARVAGHGFEADQAGDALAACGADAPVQVAALRVPSANLPRPVRAASPTLDCAQVREDWATVIDGGRTAPVLARAAARCGVAGDPSSGHARTRGSLSPLDLTRAKITSKRGWRRHPVLGKRRFHEGVDLDADPGDGVQALATGIVTFAGPRGGYGNMVELQHPITGLRTRYAHNRQILVQEGQVVSKGTVLAEAGRTGLATGVHVHLEVLRGGTKVDPMPFLRKPARLTDG